MGGWTLASMDEWVDRFASRSLTKILILRAALQETLCELGRILGSRG